MPKYDPVLYDIWKAYIIMTVEEKPQIYYADTLRKATTKTVTGGYVSLLDESYYCIRNYDALEPFFMTLVSSSNHWLFISTTGGLSAGRIDAERALFPYYTVDKITENSENTGPKTILLVTTDKGQLLWEPFSDCNGGIYTIERNLYKNIPGTAVIFEEVNHDLKLSYRYAWRTSEAYGFVKTSSLTNHRDSGCTVEILDGLQNVLPAHISTDGQNVFSNLLDAYKYNELHSPTGLGLFSLSSRLTDLPEPGEALRTNTIWHMGLANVTHLLSSRQLKAFRGGNGVTQEELVRGRRGAYFVHTQLLLKPNTEQKWHLIAEVGQDSSSVTALVKALSSDKAKLAKKIEDDIKIGQTKLEAIIACADGLQVSSDHLSTAHHFANVLFNVMRGGTFAQHHDIDKVDLQRFIAVHQPALLQKNHAFFASLPSQFTVSGLREKADATADTDTIRLCYSYLPLTFSRRHGDPSRPWNRFQINVTQADGPQKLDYQGNWRDIFQNWEALSYSYPEFIQSMISVFLNATTVDGYNPYRLTRDGIDWETPDPDNAWANIGYWNDHQIIYLQKLLEICERFYPTTLGTLLNRRIFSYANVPYKIKSYEDLLTNPYKTIEFDWDKEEIIRALAGKIGADGKLLHDGPGRVVYASLAEKLLLMLLTKLTNFVPEGGIWLNTQRPEWNDANNALVGKGLSVVTLAYMRRYVVFFIELLGASGAETLALSNDIAELLRAIHGILSTHHSILDEPVSDRQRRTIMDALGIAGSDYRWRCYRQGIAPELEDISCAKLVAFLRLAQRYIDHSLRANKRNDLLYHAYNILHLSDAGAAISPLPVMLEGQVAILSSGLLAASESLALLQAMRQSALYRQDQHSYMLYPDRQLPGFLEKNHIAADALHDSKLIVTMLENGDKHLIKRDVNGVYHFQADIRNAQDVADILATLAQEAPYTQLVLAESQHILDLFEAVFNHNAFTGRSGTFFAYEGLGSIYWHMVSKLQLAVQEVAMDAATAGVDKDTVVALVQCYEDIRAGIGFNKAPDVYGAFPTDPYSHTPMGHGAKQPGMTGMVKEAILTRLVELGIMIEHGAIVFDSTLLREQELLNTPSVLQYVDIAGTWQQINVPTNALAFTFCQVPFVVQRGDQTRFSVQYTNGASSIIEGHRLDAQTSQHIFSHDGYVQHITLHFI